MDEYRRAYLDLWAGCTAAIEEIDKRNYGRARELLIEAQQKAEESYISREEEPVQTVVYAK